MEPEPGGCLEDSAGSTLVDAGTGAGRFIPAWMAAVGPTGRVIAEDIDKVALDRARKSVEEKHYNNVELVLGAADNPMLAANSADLIVVIDAYHEFLSGRQCLRISRRP